VDTARFLISLDNLELMNTATRPEVFRLNAYTTSATGRKSSAPWPTANCSRCWPETRRAAHKLQTSQRAIQAALIARFLSIHSAFISDKIFPFLNTPVPPFLLSSAFQRFWFSISAILAIVAIWQSPYISAPISSTQSPRSPPDTPPSYVSSTQ